MRCKLLIRLEFSPCEGRAPEKANKQSCRKVDALLAIARKRRVPGTSRRVVCKADESMFCEYNYGILCVQPKSQTTGCMRIQVRSSPLTGNPLNTTQVSLIYMCLRRFLALLYGINQPVALV